MVRRPNYGRPPPAVAPRAALQTTAGRSSRGDPLFADDAVRFTRTPPAPKIDARRVHGLMNYKLYPITDGACTLGGAAAANYGGMEREGRRMAMPY